LTDLSKAWVRPPVLHFADLRIPLAIALLIAVLLDALITRIGWNFPELGLAEKWQKYRQQQKLTPATNIPNESSHDETEYTSSTPVVNQTKKTKKEPTEKPVEVLKPQETEATEPESKRQSRFARAKKGRK